MPQATKRADRLVATVRLQPVGTHGSYIYGPDGLPIEQIDTSTGTVTYLHHDQQGSTRLLTGSTGTVTGKCTYGAYRAPTCEGTTTTPLGYDGQYTSSDTGLTYLRAREYDPATAQFLSRDPAVALTREPYAYAGDNPLTYKDRSGLGIEEVLEGGSGIPCPWCEAKEGVEEAIEGAFPAVARTTYTSHYPSCVKSTGRMPTGCERKRRLQACARG
jgi:RHS repeat-associated protein